MKEENTKDIRPTQEMADAVEALKTTAANAMDELARIKYSVMGLRLPADIEPLLGGADEDSVSPLCDSILDVVDGLNEAVSSLAKCHMMLVDAEANIRDLLTVK